MTQEKYNYITKAKLNRIRERIERFRYMELNEFIDLALSCLNYQLTDCHASPTNTLIINSRKEFTFTKSVDHDKETISKLGISKICQEYTDHSHFGGTRYLKQDGVHYLVFVEPIRYTNYTPQKIGLKQ